MGANICCGGGHQSRGSNIKRTVKKMDRVGTIKGIQVVNS